MQHTDQAQASEDETDLQGRDAEVESLSGDVDGALKVALPQFAPQTGLERDVIAGSVAVLQAGLGDTMLLFQKTLAVHWTVAGSAFSALHELTESQYKELFEAVDILAERIRALGQLPPPTLSDLVAHSNLEDQPLPVEVEGMITALVSDHEAVCRHFREHVEDLDDEGDYVTADLLTARLAFHEKAVWMLRATLGQ